MISRTATFQGLVRRSIQAYEARSRRTFGFLRQKPVLGGGQNTRFQKLAQGSQTELLEALVSLREYCNNSRRANDRRRRLYKMMSWRQQRLCDDAGYMTKLEQIDKHFEKNQRVFDAVIESVQHEYGLDSAESGTWSLAAQTASKMGSQNTSTSNYRVTESLGHFVRDWAPSGEKEIAPMLHYITSQLDSLVAPENASSTCIVIPGSGLGRVAHEVAIHGNYGAVHAVEFSGLMHACNQLLYLPVSTSSHKIYPHIHTTSNFLTTEAQFRETTIPAGLKRPSNLHLHLDDFRYFAIPDRDKYDTVVVVTAFFIDTAENIMDYFDQINQLAAPSKKSPNQNGYWVNFGPLKYGSAAQAELNAAEIKHIRETMGWTDTHALNTIEEPNADFARSTLPGSGLLGYMTDRQSLWQGFYGISMWTSAHKSNRARK